VVRAAQSGTPPKPGSGPVSGTATINQKGGSGGGKLQPSFTPPGRLTDLRQENLKGWNDIISAFFDRSAIGDKDYNDGPRRQFFNPTKRPVSTTQTADISWKAFPRQVLLNSPGSDEDRWREADSSRDMQDEYCEWSVRRNREGKITRISITSEGPEYWQYLAKVQPETVLKLYQEHVSSRVEMSHLFNSAGRYNPTNRWNRDTTNGAMHLVQRNNTLSAQIELAAGASIVRTRSDGSVITDSQELIACSQYGVTTRFSDPFIGAGVNQLARTGALIAVADPVALYLDSFTPSGFTTPDGTDVSQFWKWRRGSKGLWVSAVFEVPADKGYVVGDIMHQSDTYFGPIIYGAQIIDYVKVKLTGLAADTSPSNIVKVRGCVGPVAAASSTKSASPPSNALKVSNTAAFNRAPAVAPMAKRT